MEAVRGRGERGVEIGRRRRWYRAEQRFVGWIEHRLTRGLFPPAANIEFKIGILRHGWASLAESW
jgi:hypothetical protein